MSLKESIVAASDRPTCPLGISGWPDAYARMLSVKEAESLKDIEALDCGMAEKMARIATIVIGDEGGARVFNDDEFTLLMHKPIAVLNQVVEVALAHNGLGEDSAGNAN